MTMFDHTNPIMTSAVTNRTGYQPTSQKLTLEQQYQDLSRQMQSQQVMADPYSEYQQVLGSCSDLTREKIAADPRYVQIYTECDNAIKQYLYAQCIPAIIQTQEGRIIFEKLCDITKRLKEDNAKQEADRDRVIEKLLQDELVQERLKEMQAEGEV